MIIFTRLPVFFEGALTMRFFWRLPLIGPGVFAVWRLDAARKIRWIKQFLPRGASVVEIGAGPGSVVDVMRGRNVTDRNWPAPALADDGWFVIGVDVRDSSFRDDLRPLIYDGITLPFADQSADVAMLLTVLHHVDDPDAMIGEAARIARRVIIIEDIYRTPLQRRLTKIADSITNLEFIGHPHTNRDDDGWRSTFDRLGLALVHRSEKPYAGLFLQALYVVEKAGAREKTSDFPGDAEFTGLSGSG